MRTLPYIFDSNYREQWDKYIDNKVLSEFLPEQYDEIIGKHVKELKASNIHISEQEREAINEMSNTIGYQISESNYILDNIDVTLDQQANVLRDINSNLDHLSFINLSIYELLNEKLSFTNDTLNEVKFITHIPEFQKERSYYMNEGLKYLKKAFTDGDYYSDALECLMKAYKIENRDYITLKYLGIIYFISPFHKDFSLAENYFIQSLKYSKADFDKGTITKQELIANNQVINAKEIAISCSKNLAWIAYRQDNLSDAIKHLRYVLSLNRKDTPVRFTLLKYLLLAGKEKQAKTCLKMVLADYSFRPEYLLYDKVIVVNKMCLDFINEQVKEEHKIVQQLLKQCKIAIHKDSKYKYELQMAEKSLQKVSLITVRQCKRKILNTRIRRVPKHYVFIGGAEGVKTVKDKELNLSLIDYLKQENKLLTTSARGHKAYKKALEFKRQEQAKQAEQYRIAEQNQKIQEVKKKQQHNFEIISSFTFGGGVIGIFVGWLPALILLIWDYQFSTTYWATIFICAGLGLLLGYLIKEEV